MLNGARRAGFSLVELIVAMTVLAALGLSLSQLLIAEGRFSSQQAGLRNARAVSRQSMNVMLSELRMVQDSGGIDSASADGKTIRVIVPYLFGLNCGAGTGIGSNPRNVISGLPVDSLSLAQVKYAGWAWRRTDGRYQRESLTVASDTPKVVTTSPSRCVTSAGIDTIVIGSRGGRAWDVKPRQSSAANGTPVFLYQRITYSFKASAVFAGYYGLWRKPDGGTDEELVAPFDSTARFKYWQSGATSSVASPPSLDLIRGVDVVFAGLSSYVPTGRNSPMKSTIVTSVFFKNLRSF
jgi:prepilin-type N-terminal cleavage/methylation domain-containing protein